VVVSGCRPEASCLTVVPPSFDVGQFGTCVDEEEESENFMTTECWSSSVLACC